MIMDFEWIIIHYNGLKCFDCVLTEKIDNNNSIIDFVVGTIMDYKDKQFGQQFSIITDFYLRNSSSGNRFSAPEFHG